MSIALTVVQLAVGLIILNVWLLRVNRATGYRGGDARTMREEFAVYGLPPWSFVVIGAIKVTCAVMLIGGIWLPDLTLPGGVGLCALMLGAVAMHLRVGDSMTKTWPAMTMLGLSALVAITR